MWGRLPGFLGNHVRESHFCHATRGPCGVLKGPLKRAPYIEDNTTDMIKPIIDHTTTADSIDVQASLLVTDVQASLPATLTAIVSHSPNPHHDPELHPHNHDETHWAEE